MENETSPVTGQAEGLETADQFREWLRRQARKALLSLVAEEVDALCGPRHHPASESHYRAGGVDSPVYVDGRPEKLHRPRVRRKTATGSEEMLLKSWQMAQDPAEWEEAMYRAILCGVSTRKVASLRESELRGESKSSLSRLWQKKAAALVEEFQQRDLAGIDMLVLMLDAVVLCRDLVATVALAIDTTGAKHVLGYRLGSSENKEVCADLLADLLKRGLKMPPKRSLMAVLDGSQALQTALLQTYPGTLVQRCLVHKERNVRRYLPRKYWGKLAELFKRLRSSQGAEAGKEAAEQIEQFLRDKNAQALISFEEAGEDLLTLFRLEVPSTLNVSLLSTNSIENVFKNLRRHIGRVCRWRENTAQADLWLASGIKLAQQGLRKIRNHQELPKLIAALEKRWQENHEQAAQA